MKISNTEVMAMQLKRKRKEKTSHTKSAWVKEVRMPQSQWLWAHTTGNMIVKILLYSEGGPLVGDAG